MGKDSKLTELASPFARFGGHPGEGRSRVEHCQTLLWESLVPLADREC